MAIWKSRGAIVAIALGIGAAVGVTGAFAHNDPAPKGPMSAGARAAHLRHEKFEQMGKVFKTVADEMKKDQPNRQLVTTNTQTLVTLSKQLPTWFPRGSGVEARPKSEAKANIWTDAAGFSAASAAFQAQSAKLHQAALSGNMDAVRNQLKPTGGTCKGCHDKYRLQKS